MKKVIKLSENDLHNIITESVKRVLNELDSQTYYRAADKAGDLGQYSRQVKFNQHGDNTINKELGFDSNSYIKANQSGFILMPNDRYKLKYNLASDSLTQFNDRGVLGGIEPGDQPMRLQNRAMIKTVLQYFAKYKPDSKYNNKNYWIE